jgi:hypothetical protein
MRRPALDPHATAKWLADSRDVLSNLLEHLVEARHERSRDRRGGRSPNLGTVNDASRKRVGTKRTRT